MISAEKKAALQKRMAKLEIHEDDLLEKFIRGTGSGGQKINKTSSCVYLQHLPTKLEIKCQRDRSREMNRYLARVDICQQLENIQLGRRSERQQAREKIRRRKRRQGTRARARNVEKKRQHGRKKENRRRPTRND